MYVLFVDKLDIIMYYISYSMNISKFRIHFSQNNKCDNFPQKTGFYPAYFSVTNDGFVIFSILNQSIIYTAPYNWLLNYIPRARVMKLLRIN